MRIIAPFRRACAVNDALRDNKPLLLRKLDTSILEINDKTTVENKEELIVVVVFVPVILALHDARRTTEPFTWHSVWLYQRSEHAATNEGTSTRCSGGKGTLRNVAYEYSWLTLI